MEEEKKKQAMFSCVYQYAMSPSPYKMCVVCIMCAVEQSPPDSKELCTHEAQEGLHEKEIKYWHNSTVTIPLLLFCLYFVKNPYPSNIISCTSMTSYFKIVCMSQSKP